LLPAGLGLTSVVETGVGADAGAGTGVGRAPVPGAGSGPGACTSSAAAGVGGDGSSFGVDVDACGRGAGSRVLFGVVILILHGLWREAQSLGSDLLGGLNQQQMGAPLVGLEAAALGRAQALLGELEIGESLQHLARPGEPGLKARGERTHGRNAARLGPDDTKRVRQELAALGWALGQAVGLEKRLGLLGLELVAFHRLGHGLLLLGAERAKRVGQRYAEGPLIDLALQRLTELLGKREPRMDPAGLPPAGTGDGLGTQLLLVPQRPDHPRLVHRRQRPARPVGLEQGHHPLSLRARCLHQHRHLLQTETAPADEPLEAVDELVGSFLGWHHAQRQRTEHRILCTTGKATAAQLGQARAHVGHPDPLEPGAALRGRRAGQRDRKARRAHCSSPASGRPTKGGGPPAGTASTWRKPSLACT